MGKVEEIRLHTLDDLRESYAIDCLLNRVTKSSLVVVENLVDEIEKTRSTHRLDVISDGLRAKIKAERAHFNVTGPREVLIRFLKIALAVPPGSVFYARKHSLSQLTSIYDSFINLPPHAEIAIDVHGENDLEPPIVLYRLLEADLYRDMCALYNLAFEAAHSETEEDRHRRTLKATASALARAALVAAYHFVEAYINGTAESYLLTRGHTLDARTAGFLEEWNIEKNREKYNKLRDKLLHYPRIIQGLKHPPIQETSCKALKVFLEEVKPIRDSIAHPSPALCRSTNTLKKESTYFETSLVNATEAVDSAIALVCEIEQLLRSNLNQIKWLLIRTPGRPFSNEALAGPDRPELKRDSASENFSASC